MDELDKQFLELSLMEDKLKNEIYSTSNSIQGLKKYGLLNSNWFVDYNTSISNLYRNNINGKITYDLESMSPVLEKKDYSFLNKRYTFPCNFSFVTKKFLDSLSKYFIKQNDIDEIKRHW